MATPSIGSATANVKGGLFGDSAGLLTLAQISGRSSARRKVAQELESHAEYPIRQILATLIGAAPGATATKTISQIDGSTAELGGKRTINSVSVINRATTAADATEVIADFTTLQSRTSFGANPPANKDGSPLGEKR